MHSRFATAATRDYTATWKLTPVTAEQCSEVALHMVNVGQLAFWPELSYIQRV
jgi:hypothetical protein